MDRTRGAPRHARPSLALLLWGALVLHAATAGATTLALTGEGGDAWAFETRITGTIAGRCDTVVIAAPRGRIPAKVDGPRFDAVVPLDAGVNELRAHCDEGGRETAVSAPQRWIERLPDLPRATVHVAIAADGVMLDGSASTPASARPAPLQHYEWRPRAGNPAPLRLAEGGDLKNATGPRLSLATPPRDGVYGITLRVIDEKGRADESTVVFRVAEHKPELVDPATDHPAWVDDAVVYGVAPSLLGPHGLAQVTRHLDAIAALGATVIWLSPIADTSPGDFGYAVTDPFHIRADLGNAADLHRLVAEAHARGLRVILDFVANHLSDHSPYYVDVRRHGAASPYRAFFARDASGAVSHYFDWTNLENLDYGDPDVQRYEIAAATHWVRDFDVDGFRVDAAWAVRQRAPGFWPRWRAALKRIKPDLLLLAEASARDPYYTQHGFDAAYDWTGKLGEWAWQNAFAPGAPTAARLRAAIGADASAKGFVFRFLDNNDTGARFITRHGAARTRVAAAMLMTLPGIPCIYMGDEVGAAFSPYAATAPIDWRDPSHLRAYYTRLIALRHALPALRSRSIELIDSTSGDRVLAYLRPGDAAAGSVLVLLNYGAAPATVALRPTTALAGLVGTPLVDRLTGQRLSLDPAAPSIVLPSFGVRILQRASPPGR